MAPARFAQIETWIFDLDNTLYPADLNLWPQVEAKIRDFIGRFFAVGPEQALRIQTDYSQRYGTSLRGLMLEHGITAETFLRFVHAIDHSPLRPDPKLGAAIASLPGRKLILTNATCAHAHAVLEHLGLGRHFDGVFDIVAAQLQPKPLAQTYERLLAAHAVDPARAAIFEDLARNLAIPHTLGMTTVLVRSVAKSRLDQPWALAGAKPDHVDYLTDDLAAFLQAIARLPLASS